jgi:hypothetical protein
VAEAVGRDPMDISPRTGKGPSLLPVLVVG